MFGSSELMVIVLVIVILFGSSAIPKFAKSLGQAKAEFEKGFKDGKKAETAESSASSDKKDA